MKQIYKVVQIWQVLFVCKQVTVCPGYIWTTLYLAIDMNMDKQNYEVNKTMY
jgi:hypothetical protein